MAGPRELFEDPQLFGIDPGAQLGRGNPVDLARAQLCHDVAVAVRQLAAERDWTPRQLASALATKPSYLQRKLSGHLPITLNDLACWTTVLNLTVAVTL